MINKRYLSTTEAASLLDISRIAIYKKIKKGQIKAKKVGRNFVIDRKILDSMLGRELTRQDKLEIEKAVRKTVREYGETLRLLEAE